MGFTAWGTTPESKIESNVAGLEQAAAAIAVMLESGVA